MRFLSHYEEVNSETSVLGFDILQRWGIAVRNSEAIAMTCKKKSILNMLVSVLSHGVHMHHPDHVRDLLSSARGPFEEEKYRTLSETVRRIMDAFSAIPEGEEKEFLEAVDSVVCLKAKPLDGDS